MDNLRGMFDSGEPGEAEAADPALTPAQEWDEPADSDQDGSDQDDGAMSAGDVPPAAIGQDERRMQVRAYNHWASLLGESDFPSIEDLEPSELPDFGPHSVLLDFSGGIDDPVVQYLGDRLAEECGTDGSIETLGDVPPRSLLSRITDHYMQILANEAPIGFEAEFVNQRGSSILYRGILLPFSSDGETIDFIYGVINWKEMADQVTSDELLLEIDQALEGEPDTEDEDEPQRHHADALTEWADSPASESDGDSDAADFGGDVLDLGAPGFGSGFWRAGAGDHAVDLGPDPVDGSGPNDSGLPMPDFGQYALDDPEDEDDEDGAGYNFASLTDYIEAPVKKAIDLDADKFDPEDYRVEDDEEESPLEDDAYADLGQFGPDWQEGHSGISIDFDIAQDGPQGETGADGSDAQDADYGHAVDGDVDGAGAAESGDDDKSETEPVESGGFAHDPVAENPVFEEPVAEEPVAEDTADDLPDNPGLHDFLASARELAQTARASEDRSRNALYQAVGRAYDFSLAAQECPREFTELVEESGLTVQERAPMTPVVKLVFGSDYDKTRLTEYAAVLSHAHRLGLERGSLAGFLGEVEGGLKAVVRAERRLRREEAGKPAVTERELREELAAKLRELEAMTLEALDGDGPEFGIVIVRRDETGMVELLGEIEEDVPLIERAARKLIG